MKWGIMDFEVQLDSEDVKYVDAQRIELPEGETLRVPPQLALIFLDDAHFADAISKKLRSAGVSTYRATDLNEVREFLRDHDPQIIITYDNSEGVAGLHIQEWLHKNERDIPMVVRMGRTKHYAYFTSVRLVHQGIGASDMTLIAVRVLAQSPHSLISTRVTHVVQNEQRPAGDVTGAVKAVRTLLDAAVTKYDGHVERVGDGFEWRSRSQIPFNTSLFLHTQVRWQDPRLERFIIELNADIPSAKQTLKDVTPFVLRPQRGIVAQLKSMFRREQNVGDELLDNAYLIHAGAESISFLKEQRNILLDLAEDSTGIEQNDEQLIFTFHDVPRHRIERVVRASHALWDASLRRLVP